MAKTSIDIDDLKLGEIESDGGMSLSLTSVGDMEEKTVKFNGSEAATTPFKNHKGETLEESAKEGDITIEFKVTDFTPTFVASFTDGTSGAGTGTVTFKAPDGVPAKEMSVQFTTQRGITWNLPRVSLSAYPMVDDGGLHGYMVKGRVLKPTKTGVAKYDYEYASV
ncbi:MAG: hypothetical protein CVU09_00195 [Bacteroidetes bacterium HGW-Bacteroidetes-4]|jgi:hypothetical protein|nr:MAG: hypothetical protein CVU09_00195 [Bacteroidetes bacterium HGW-Bacteroidetes-4]